MTTKIEIDNIRKQIATLTAALDALEGASVAKTDDLSGASIWMDATVVWERPVDFSNSTRIMFDCSSLDIRQEFNGKIAVPLDRFDYSIRKDGTIVVNSWDDEDILDLLRGEIKVIDNCGLEDWSFDLSSGDTTTDGRRRVVYQP